MRERIWNPIGLLTFYLLRVVALSDVPQSFFQNRRLRRCAIMGPGLLTMSNDCSLTSCHFVNCDFIVVPLGSHSRSVMVMRGLDAKSVRFEGLAFLVVEDTMQRIRQSVRESSEVPDELAGVLAPVTPG